MKFTPKLTSTSYKFEDPVGVRFPCFSQLQNTQYYLGCHQAQPLLVCFRHGLYAMRASSDALDVTEGSEILLR